MTMFSSKQRPASYQPPRQVLLEKERRARSDAIQSQVRHPKPSAIRTFAVHCYPYSPPPGTHHPAPPQKCHSIGPVPPIPRRCQTCYIRFRDTIEAPYRPHPPPGEGTNWVVGSYRGPGGRPGVPPGTPPGNSTPETHERVIFDNSKNDLMEIR